MTKNSKRILCLSLCLCLISILFAGAIQTDWGKVDMEELSLETKAGTLTAYIFRPDTATVENPAPAIVASHGYLNNREMQDCNYIELARRGYVVIAMNAYAHGDSDVARDEYADSPEVKSGGMIEFVRYLASLPYVDKTQIGVTGHSMGGGYTITTMHYFSGLEREALENGASPEDAHALNLVNTGVPVGNYPTVAVDEMQPLLCSVGIIEGMYDEFFYSTSLDMLTSDTSHTLLQLQAGTDVNGAIEEGHFYTNPSSGYSLVFYNPPQFHATNHFSTKVVSYLVTAFEHSMPAPKPIPANDQVWVWKEIFNLIGLVGFFMFIIPFADLLLDTKLFSELRAKKPELLPPPDNMKKLRGRSIWRGILTTLVTIPFLLIGYLLMLTPLWPQDTTGGVALWCVISGVICLCGVRKDFGKLKGHGKELHISIGWPKFRKTLLLAVIVCGCTYALVFAADFINQTDYRIWSFDIRVFSANKLWVMLKYLPFFAVYYIFNALSISRTSFNTWTERKQITFSVLLNIMAPALILIITYVPTIFLHKTLWVALFAGADGLLAMLPSALALIPILMIPFVPILAIAAVLNVKLYRKTNSIWLPAIINSLLITMITVANTSFSFPY